MTVGYIYVLWDKNENDIFYVGSTVNPTSRLAAHKTDNRTYDDRLNRVNIKERSFNMSIIDEMEFQEKSELCHLEAYWYHQLIQWGFSLTNGHHTKKIKLNPFPKDVYDLILNYKNEIYPNKPLSNKLLPQIFIKISRDLIKSNAGNP